MEFLLIKCEIIQQKRPTGYVILTSKTNVWNPRYRRVMRNTSANENSTPQSDDGKVENLSGQVAPGRTWQLST